MAGSRRASTYQNDDIHVLVLDMQWDPEVTVVVGNVLDETIKLRQEGYRPVMLNVGNNLVPGGDYHLDDASNNEADLFRRTTLYQCLDQEPRRSRFYPLPENGGVYCPNQAVFRHGMDRNNEFMDRFEWISVVSVAPIPKMETREKEGGLGGVQFLEGEDDLLRRRILAAMKVGVSQGHDALVLPPHGTDAGQNPAEAIAAIYRSIIGRDFMGGRKRFQTYKKIIMVLDPEEAFKVVNETSSYRPTQPPAITATPLPAEVDTLETSGDTNGTDTEEQNHEENHDDQKKGSSLRRRSSSSEEEDENESLDSKSSELDEQEDKNEDENDQDAEVVETSDDDDSTEEADDQEESTSDDKQAEDPIIDEDAEEVAEDGDEDGDGLLNDNLSPEDEVSESEALQEEQDLEEDVDLSEEALEEDLSDVPIPAKPDTTSEDKDSENEQGQDVDEETGLVEDESSEQDETSNENQEKPEQVVFVPIIETVKDVFERMLEQRSLLIVKNRARGLPDPDNSDTNNMNKSSGNSTETATPSSTIRSAVPTLSSA
ncbi:hypothetical protein BGZ54_001109 [Gamsiella multidivaricata]|nr:hypothetical protein BGZ54_001109 [Gamsiella multidivaricata]